MLTNTRSFLLSTRKAKSLSLVVGLSMALSSCSTVPPAPVPTAPRTQSWSDSHELGEVIVIGHPTPHEIGGDSGGYYPGGGYSEGGGYYGGGSEVTPMEYPTTSGGGEAAPTVENGQAEDSAGSVGDYHKICKVVLPSGITIRVLVEATLNDNPPKLEKITVFASGLTPAMKFIQLGDGTGTYDVVNNAFHFTTFYQIEGASTVLSRESTLSGTIYLNIGCYVLQNQN